MQAIKRLPSSGTASVNRSLMNWRVSVPWHLFFAYADFTKPFKLHTDAFGSGLGAVLYQTHEDGTNAVIAYASWSLSKAESHYPAHKLEFLTLKWAVVQKFHEYLYGSSFDIYADNNPIIYILATAKLDAASHWWVASLANYNFWLHYQARKAKIDAGALSRVSWSGCIPDNSGTRLKVTALAVQAVQEAALKGPASPIEAYSYDLHVLDTVQDSQQVTYMTLEDWCQAQQEDLTLSLVISRIWDGTLGQQQFKPTDPPKFGQFLWECNHLLFKWHPVQMSKTQEIWGDPLSVGSASHPERGCSKGMPW